MSEPREFYIPEDFIFNSVDEAMEKYPDQAISVLWDLSSMKSEADKLADWMQANIAEMECREDNDCDHCLGLEFLKEYRGES